MNDYKEHIKVVTTNRRARHEYFIEDTLEAGLILTGTEIKSIRQGRVSIGDGFVQERVGELWLLNVHISPFDEAADNNHDPLRARKLLMHRKEINRWSADIQQRGYTVIPLRLYLRNGYAKVEIGLAKGKKLYDKRQKIAEKETQRRIDRTIKGQNVNW